MEAAVVAQLPDTIRDRTKIAYGQNAAALYRLLFDKEPGSKSQVTFLSKPSNYKRIPELLRKDEAQSSAHSKYNVINMASALAGHLGYTAANKFLKGAVGEFKPARDLLLTQEQEGETLKDNGVPYSMLLDRVKTELIPKFTRLVASHRTIDQVYQRRIVIRALIGVLNVIEPNCRSAFAVCKIVHQEPPAALVGDGKTNLIYVPPKGPCEFFCNTDKVSGPNRLGPDHWELGESASKIVRQSLEIYPRTWLFTKSLTDDEPMTKWTYLHEIGQTFTYGDRIVANNVLRHAIVNHFYEKYSSPSIATKKWLARRMRHTAATQEAVYRKVAGDPTEERVDLGED